jgi:hypothetical protein
LSALSRVVACLTLLANIVAHADPAAQAVVVDIDIESTPAEVAQVRSAIEKELSLPTILLENAAAVRSRGTLKVRLERSKKTLAVTWTDDHGSTVSRTIASSGDIDSVTSSSALLAGNLVRDQTSDLVDALRPAAPAPAEPAPPAPPATDKAAAPAAAAPSFPANLAFFYPLATNMGKPDLHTNLDVGLLYSRVGGVEGVQASGLAGRIDGHLRGAQASGLFGVTESADGLQAAGGASITTGLMHGAQFAGGANIAGELRGLQSAPVNVAGDVDGLQVGVVNVGRRIRGAQVGVVNVSDDIEGAAVGVVNVSNTGAISVTTWASTSAYGNLGVKFATRYFYSIASLAYHHDGQGDLAGYGLALGARLPIRDAFSAAIDVAATDLWRLPTIDSNRRLYYARPRLLARYELTPAVTAFGGFGIGVTFENDFAARSAHSEAILGVELTP